jgi:hypothetical protein
VEWMIANSRRFLADPRCALDPESLAHGQRAQFGMATANPAVPSATAVGLTHVSGSAGEPRRSCAEAKSRSSSLAVRPYGGIRTACGDAMAKIPNEAREEP